jgi:hypothetical protein
MAIYTLTPQQLKGAGVYNSFEIPAGGGGVPFTNTKSILLDGGDDFVSMGNVLNMADDGTDAFSMSLWFKTSTNGIQQLIGKSATNGYNLYTQSGVIYFGFGTFGSNGIWGRSSVGTPLYNGTWQHLVLTYDGSQDISGFSMYFNNTAKVIQTSQNTTPSGVSTTNIFAIGARGNTGSPSLEFNGNIDEASFFNTELSASDVNTIYNSGVPNDISSLNPVGWWRCGDGDTSPTLIDNGSGGNNGTMTNFTTFSTDVPT